MSREHGLVRGILVRFNQVCRFLCLRTRPRTTACVPLYAYVFTCVVTDTRVYIEQVSPVLTDFQCHQSTFDRLRVSTFRRSHSSFPPFHVDTVGESRWNSFDRIATEFDLGHGVVSIEHRACDVFSE